MRKKEGKKTHLEEQLEAPRRPELDLPEEHGPSDLESVLADLTQDSESVLIGCMRGDPSKNFVWEEERLVGGRRERSREGGSGEGQLIAPSPPSSRIQQDIERFDLTGLLASTVERTFPLSIWMRMKKEEGGRRGVSERGHSFDEEDGWLQTHDESKVARWRSFERGRARIGSLR